jgi:hypothetical protein
MATNTPKNTITSAVSGVLATLSQGGGYVTLGIEAAGVVIPLVKGLIGEIRQIGHGTDTVQYQILITADLAELDDVKKLATDDLTAINAELTALGLPVVAIPAEAAPVTQASTSAAGPAADPAPGSNSLT